MAIRTWVLMAALTALVACSRSPPPVEPRDAPAIGTRAVAAKFSAPVSVLPALGYGFEPTVTADRFGNIFVTAHKSAAQLAVSPDVDTPSLTRSMSWTRMSADGGATWKNLPGLTAAALEVHYPGIEGDFAFDDLGRLYHVDTYVVDITLTRWIPTALDQVTFDYTAPAARTVNPVDDRPWITAHGDGHVVYMGNEGTGALADPGPREGSGFGAGSNWMHTSYDGGKTFDRLGYPLKNSASCRPASDARSTPDVHYVYAFCADLPVAGQPARLASFVSSDDGASFERYEVASFPTYLSYPGNPSLVMAPDFSLWALYIGADDRWSLFHSTDHGKTWSQQDITPEAGRYVRAWLAVGPTGQLGVGVYHSAPGADWFVYGAIWKPGETPKLASLDPSNPIEPAAAPTAGADYMGSFFAPDGRLHVVWDRAPLRLPDPNLVTTARLHEIWHSRSE